jgi:hypothetical protein
MNTRLTGLNPLHGNLRSIHGIVMPPRLLPEGDEHDDAGAADADAAEDTTDEGDDSEDDADDEGADQLGDAGKKALDSMKAKWQAERAKRREAEARAAAKAPTDDEAAKVRAEVEAAAQQKANQRILRSEVKAAAAGKLADPADAYKFLDLDQFEVDSDGNVDEDEIADAIADLISKKPYLAAAGQSGAGRAKGSADGGARKESKPAQISKADLQRMYREGRHDEITKARQDGRLNGLMGVTG